MVKNEKSSRPSYFLLWQKYRHGEEQGITDKDSRNIKIKRIGSVLSYTLHVKEFHR